MFSLATHLLDARLKDVVHGLHAAVGGSSLHLQVQDGVIHLSRYVSSYIGGVW